MIKRIKAFLSDKDERNLIINIMLAFFVKGASLIVSMISLPLYIKYFDDNATLGVWYTLLSVISWISVCDLGLGSGLRNRLTEALAKGERDTAKKYVSSTYAAMSVIILPIILIAAVAFLFVDFNSLLNISRDVVDEGTLRGSIIILFAGVCISFVLKGIYSVIYAIQKSSITNILTLISSVIPVIFVLFYNGESVAENLTVLSVVHVIAINLPLIAATVVIFSSKRFSFMSPTLKVCEKKCAFDMLGFGLQFFFAQIFLLLLLSTNEFYITTFFAPEYTVEYSIYYKLFTVVGSLFMLALTPLWSKVTKDYAEKKYRKIQRTNRFLYLMAGLAALMQFVMVLMLQWIINVWLGADAITVDYTVALAFATFGSLYIFNVVLTTMANGIGDLKTQMIFYGAFAALKIPAIIIMKELFSATWSFIVIYNCIALLVFCAVQLVWCELKIKKIIKDNNQ